MKAERGLYLYRDTDSEGGERTLYRDIDSEGEEKTLVCTGTLTVKAKRRLLSVQGH